MVDAVETRVLRDDLSHFVIHCTNISDGTGEAAVVKADISTLIMAAAKAGNSDITPTSFVVERCTGIVMGEITANTVPVPLTLAFDATTDEVFLYAAVGRFEFDWRAEGGLKDPKATGFTGDIVCTFDSGASTLDGYSFTLWLRKKA